MSDNLIYVEQGDLLLFLRCAIRYAAGRRTYMPSLVVDKIKEYGPFLTYDEQGLILEEIVTQLDWLKGDETHPFWLHTYEELSELFKERMDEQ